MTASQYGKIGSESSPLTKGGKVSSGIAAVSEGVAAGSRYDPYWYEPANMSDQAQSDDNRYILRGMSSETIQ